MKFQKGKSGNPDGRPRGAENKATRQIRESLKSLVENNISNLQKDLDSLKGMQRVEAICKLSAFVLPKLQATDIQLTTTDPITDFIKMSEQERIAFIAQKKLETEHEE